jgi:hypothetical protein
MMSKTADALLVEARVGLARLSPEDARAAWQAGALLVDTRSADEQHEQGGVIPGALHHPLSVVSGGWTSCRVTRA